MHAKAGEHRRWGKTQSAWCWEDSGFFNDKTCEGFLRGEDGVNTDVPCECSCHKDGE